MSGLQGTHKQRQHGAWRAQGFTLIELMVAMLLGLIVVGGVISVFVASQQTYRANEALGDVEDGSRTAFEMLARDLRYAGTTGCDNTNGRIANVVNDNTTLWYANWSVPLLGYDDASKDPVLSALTSTYGTPVAGSSSVRVLGTVNADVSVGSASDSPTSFNINAASTQLAAGDIVMLCDFDHATILQIGSYSSGGTSVGYTASDSPSPGNCSAGLGYPTICTSSGNAYTFLPNARVALTTAVVWYIGNNPVGGKSLYRLPVTYSSTGASATTPQEMVRNVNSMQINYLQSAGTAFTNAAGVGDWAAVNAAQVTLTLQSTNQKANVSNSGPLTRTFTSTTTMRNRVQ